MILKDQTFHEFEHNRDSPPSSPLRIKTIRCFMNVIDELFLKKKLILIFLFEGGGEILTNPLPLSYVRN